MTYVRNKKIKKIIYVLIGIYVISQCYHLSGGDIRWSHDKRFIAISRAPIIPDRNGLTGIIVIEPFKMKMERLDSYFLREYRGFAWKKKPIICGLTLRILVQLFINIMKRGGKKIIFN